jgi:hypothetical protein
MAISRWFLFRVRNISNKSSIENQNARFMFSDFFPPENRSVYEKAENVVEPERPQMTSQ